jgi:hypothetical protein
MPNPTLQNSSINNQTRMTRGPVQMVSDTKWATRVLAIGVAPAVTDFFTAPPAVDKVLDNYDAGNQLVTSNKEFVIQGITVNVSSTSIADIDAVVQRGCVVLTAQNKEIGWFRVRQLCAGGGTYVAGAQVAAASSVGVTNGLPNVDLFRVAELRIAANQSFKAQLVMPTTTTYTIIAATSVEIALQGYEIRPAA